MDFQRDPIHGNKIAKLFTQVFRLNHGQQKSSRSKALFRLAGIRLWTVIEVEQHASQNHQDKHKGLIEINAADLG